MITKEKILDVLEKHYHGRNFIDNRCADDIMSLINFKDKITYKDWLIQKCDYAPDYYEAISLTDCDAYIKIAKNIEELKTLIDYERNR